MSSVRTIGLFSAILINVNIIIGGGMFMNVHPLLSYGGAWSFVAYMLAALCLFPIVAVLALMARRHPESGGLFVYPETYLHPFMGFLCGWAYFVGKTVSLGVLTHTIIICLEQLVPALTAVPHLALVACALLLFGSANIFGASIHGPVQWVFVAAKALPVAMIAGLFFLNGRQVALPAVMPAPDVFGVMVPVAMWAILGFEVTCTIAHLFKDPDYTIPRAFLIGFTIVAATATLFQFGVSALVPAQGMGSFPLGTAAAMYLPSLAGAQKVLMAAVYASMMGGAFSILTSNTWNLHRLALHGYMPMKSWLLKTTKRNVPWVCLIVEIAIALVVLVITEQQVPLQKMSSLGMIVAFLCAVLASFYARTKDDSRRLINPLLSLLALASTCLLGSITIYHIWKFGVSLPYVVLLGSGIVAGVWVKSREM